MRSWLNLSRSASSRGVCFFIFFLSPVILARSNTRSIDTFIYPVGRDGNSLPVYDNLDSVKVSWTSNFDAPWLHLWCTSNEDPAKQLQRRRFPHNPASFDEPPYHSPKLYTSFILLLIPSIVSKNKILPYETSFVVFLDIQAAFDRCHFQLTSDPNGGGDVDGHSIDSTDFKILHQCNRNPKIWSSSTPTNYVENQSPISGQGGEKSSLSNTSDLACATDSTITASTFRSSTIPTSSSSASTPSTSSFSQPKFPAPTSPEQTPLASASISNARSRDALSIIAKTNTTLSFWRFLMALIAGATFFAWI